MRPRGTPENRPMRDASKPANEVEAGQMQYRYIYTLAPMAATRKIAFDAYWPILVGPGRRIRQRRDATGAPIQRPECGNGAWRGGASRPSKTSYSGGKAVNPRGMGTESPSKYVFPGRGFRLTSRRTTADATKGQKEPISGLIGQIHAF